MASQSIPNRHPYQPLVIVLAALAAGIVFDRYGWVVRDIALESDHPVRFLAWWALAASALATWRFVHWLRRDRAAACLLLLSVAFAAATWHDLYWFVFSSDDVGRFATLDARPTCIRAIVLATPEILPAPQPTPLRAIPGGERSRTDVRLTGIRDGTDWLAADGRCQLVVYGDLLPAEPGDEVQIFGQLRRPAPPMNPGEFDFAARARADRRLATLTADSPDCVTVVAPNKRWSLDGIVEALREYGKQTLRTYVGPRQAGIAAAVLLGIREELPREEIMPFFLTGTVHLLVVSGLNVAILASGLYSLVWIGWLPRRMTLTLIVAIVTVYTLVAGGEPPVLRAAVLVVLVCVGAWSGRRGAAFNSLAAAAVFVLAINPTQLVQTGTQLSFLCVAVLIWDHERFANALRIEADPLDQLIASARPWYLRGARWVLRWTGWLMVTSGVVWFTTLPLVLYRFHVASPVALAIAPAVWLLALVAMWAGFITLACGWLAPLVAVVAGAICNWSLGELVWVVDWAETLPGGHVWAPAPALWWIIGFYVGFVAVMLWGNSLATPRWQIAMLCLWILIGLAPALARPWTRGDDLRCTFLAMGHGTCAVLETPDGQTLLYDAGSLGPPEYATESVAGFLWQRGILRIDGIILSHADVDHYNAVPGLLERFSVGAVYVAPQMFDWYGATGPRDAPTVLQHAIDEAGVPIREVWSGDRLRAGNVTIEVIHPPRDGVVGSDNANSMTVAVEYAGRRLLLPGDLETPGIDDVIAEPPIDCDVVMAPHHGSRRSDPPGFAAWSTPEWAIISGGADADPEVLLAYRLAGAQVRNTGQLGAVQFCLNHSGIQTKTWLDRRHDQSR